jgi:hypothetical protein
MLMTAIVLAIIAAVVQVLVGIPQPWQKIIFIGIVVIFIVGLVQLLLPGALHGNF